MTSSSTPKQGILDAARKLNERRMGAIDALASSRARIVEVQQLLAEAEAEDAVKYAAAVKAGWSESELKAVGIGAPATRVPGRPARASSNRPRSQSGGGRIPEPGNAMLAAGLRREAHASVALDGETHAVGEPVGAGT